MWQLSAVEAQLMVYAVSPDASIPFLGKGIQMLLTTCRIQILFLFWWMFNNSLLPDTVWIWGVGWVSLFRVFGFVLVLFFFSRCPDGNVPLSHFIERELGVSFWTFSSFEAASHSNRCKHCAVAIETGRGKLSQLSTYSSKFVKEHAKMDGVQLQTAFLSRGYTVHIQSIWWSMKATFLAFFAFKPSKK